MIASGLVLLAAVAASATTQDRDEAPAVYYGTTSRLAAAWEQKHPRAVMVTFCAPGTPPPEGTRVTVLSNDGRLPPAIARTARTQKRQGTCKPVQVEFIRLHEWRDAWSVVGGPHDQFPGVLVLQGEWPDARAVPSRALRPALLPRGTESGDVRIAIDIDGDGTTDAIARAACKDERRNCPVMLSCLEVWVRGGERWRRVDRICPGDDEDDE